MLHSTGSKTVGHNLATEQQQQQLVSYCHISIAWWKVTAHKVKWSGLEFPEGACIQLTCGLLGDLNLCSYFHFVFYDIDNHQHAACGCASSAEAGGKQLTSAAGAHVFPTGTGRCWQSQRVVSASIVWLTKRSLITNSNNASATQETSILMTMMGRGRRWVVELAQKAVKRLAQSQPGRGTPGNSPVFPGTRSDSLRDQSPERLHGCLSILEVGEQQHV